VADAYLGLGSNLGDRAANLDEATRRLGSAAGTAVVARSGVYETPPWGDADQPPFLNAALRIETSLSPLELLDLALSTERDLGRVRTRRWGPRTIDIDLLAYDDLGIADERLTLPHPRLFERAFVLVPLAEIAPQQRIGGVTAAEAASRIDKTGVALLRPDTSGSDTGTAS
jgi:2-amino-4-hydroxy-6-hydroxymethyldihydropteridine diphosphokinase